MNVLSDDAVRLRRGERDITGHLLLRDSLCAEAERRGIGVARLHFKARPVNATAIEARRRPGLKPASAQTQQLERFAQKLRWWFTTASGRICLLAAMDQPIEESSGSDDDGLRAYPLRSVS